MTVQEFNLTIEQGASFEQEITINGPDYSAWDGSCDFRKQPSQDSAIVASPTVVIEPIYATPFDPLNPPDPLPAITGSLVTLSLTAQETRTIPVQARTWNTSEEYVYDVFVTDSVTGKALKVLRGKVTINPSVTR